MTSRDRDYEALRAAIHELRVADERDAPPFDAILARRTPRRASTRPSLRRLAIAAALVLAAGIAYRETRRDRLTVPTEVVALLAWRPQSDVLLETPVSNLLREAPRLGASLINTSMTGELR